VVLGRRAKPETWMPDYVEPNPLGDKHESLRGAWWLLEFLPHRYVTRESGSHIARYRIPMGSNRAIPERSVFHETMRFPPTDRLPKHYTTEPRCPFPNDV
jgi:hypothetical protein